MGIPAQSRRYIFFLKKTIFPLVFPPSLLVNHGPKVFDEYNITDIGVMSSGVGTYFLFDL